LYASNCAVSCIFSQWNALGGAAVLAFLARGKTVIAVQDNTTTMRVTGTDLLQSGGGSSSKGSSCAEQSKTSQGKPGRVVLARSYAEAAGMIAALKEGILLDAITPFVPPISVTAL
jgi:hypothetical protein